MSASSGEGARGGASVVGTTAGDERAFVPLGDPKATEVSALVGPDGKATLSFERVKGNGAALVRARLLPFRAGESQVARVGLASSQDADHLVVEQELALGQGERELTVELRTWKFPPVGEYEGRLVLLPEDARQLAYKVKLSAAKPYGYLAVEPTQAQVETVRRVLSSKLDGASFSLLLHDRDGSNALVGLRARPAGENRGPHGSLSLSDHLTLSIDGRPVPELWSTGLSDANPSSVPEGNAANKVVNLLATVHDLEPGEYHFGLKFESPNSRTGSDQQVAITATVRHPMWFALGALLLGAFSSFVGVGLVANRRAALDFERAIAGLGRDWLAALPPLPAVVWLRATRRMCRDLVKGGRALLIPSKEALAEPLRRAAALLPLLQDCQRAHLALDATKTPRMRVYHERQRLEKIVRSLDLDELTDGTVKEKRAAVAATPGPESAAACSERKARLTGSFRVDQFSAYVGDGRAKLDALYKQISNEGGEGLDRVEAVFEVLVERRDGLLDQFTEDAGNGRAKLDALYKQIPNEDSDGLDRVEAVLKVLFDRRDDLLFARRGANAAHMRALVAALPSSGMLNDVDLGDFLRVADQQSWERLESQQNALVVTPPALAARPGNPLAAKALNAPEALVPFSLCIEVSGDPDLSKDFMLTSRVDCTWTFTLEPKSRLPWRNGRFAPQAVTWTERSSGNEIVQFAPAAGVLKVSAQLSFEGRPAIRVPDHFLKVDRERELSLVRGLGAAQVLATFITIVVALFTGLTAQYFTNATFGSFRDYFALFTWAATLDAIKNVMQGVTATTPPSAAPAPGTPPPSGTGK